MLDETFHYAMDFELYNYFRSLNVRWDLIDKILSDYAFSSDTKSGSGGDKIIAKLAVPGAREQFGEACLLFDPLDPGALASTVAKLKAEPELRRLNVAKGLKLTATRSAASVVERAIAVAVACKGFRHAWPGSWSR